MSVGAVALSLLMFASCSESKPKTIEDLKPSTTVDSLSYYFGVMQSAGYWQFASQDSTVKTDENTQAYLKGLKAGIAAMEGMSEAERNGFLAGLQIAMSAQQFDEEYGEKLKTDFVYEGYRAGVVADSVHKNPIVSNKVNGIIQQLQKQKQEKIRKTMSGKLGGFGKQGYNKIDEVIYKKAGKAGTGENLKMGDKINVTMQIADSASKKMDIPMPQNAEIVVGQTFPMEVINKALTSMKSGEEAIFAMPAADLFNGGQKQFGLNDESIVLVTISTNPAGAAKPDSVAAKPVAVKPAAK